MNNAVYISENIESIDVYASYVYFAGGSGTNWSVHEVAYYRIEILLDSCSKITLTSLYGYDLYFYIKEYFPETTIIEHRLLFVPSYWI